MKKITTSDLRLGNWLYESDKSKFPMQVEGIGKDWIYLNFEGNESDVFENTDKEIYPIPLNKQLLENIGFKFSNDYAYLGEFTLNYYKDGFMISVNENDRHITEPISFVHELQNLYYALTGKELEIKREWL